MGDRKLIGLKLFLDSLWNFGFKNGGLHSGGDIECFPGRQDVVRSFWVKKKEATYFLSLVLYKENTNLNIKLEKKPSPDLRSEIILVWIVKTCWYVKSFKGKSMVHYCKLGNYFFKKLLISTKLSLTVTILETGVSGVPCKSQKSSIWAGMGPTITLKSPGKGALRSTPSWGLQGSQE